MTTSANPSVESAKQSCNAILASLAGLGSTWAAYGLKLGQIALEQSADALGKTAHTLETLASELDKKHAEAGEPSPAAPVDAPAANL